MALRRIKKQLQAMRLESEYRVEEQSSNPFLIQLTLFGPSGSIYEGGRFKVQVAVPSDYPFKAPAYRLKTKILHPNLTSQQVCCCMLLTGAEFNPAITMDMSIKQLLRTMANPNGHEGHIPASDARDLFIADRDAFNRKAKEWVQLYAQ